MIGHLFDAICEALAEKNRSIDLLKSKCLKKVFETDAWNLP